MTDPRQPQRPVDPSEHTIKQPTPSPAAEVDEAEQDEAAQDDSPDASE
jgi:hypothetical protein